MLSIQMLLSSQGVTHLDHGGGAPDLDGMQETWARLWRDFGAYTEIRDHLVGACDAGLPFFPTTMASAKMLEYLLEAGLLRAYGATYQFSCPRAGQRLRGSWLEELGATVAQAAGADEVRFSQKLSWRRPYDRRLYFNEVDVLARFGERLAFVSCKALAPMAAVRKNGPRTIADAIKEVARWRKDFGDGIGYAVLLTTADFIDEVRHEFRNKALTERASRLRVQLVSADAGDFEGLVNAFKSCALGRYHLIA